MKDSASPAVLGEVLAYPDHESGLCLFALFDREENSKQAEPDSHYDAFERRDRQARSMSRLAALITV